MILGIYFQIDMKVLNSKYATKIQILVIQFYSTFLIRFEIIVHINKINTIEKFVCKDSNKQYFHGWTWLKMNCVVIYFFVN